MRILQLGKAQPPIKGLGGVEKVIQSYYYGLNSINISCDVLGVNDKFKYKIDNYINDGLVFREKLFLHLNSTFLSFHLIFRLIRIHNKYDIIHVHHPDPMSFLALLFIKFKGKLVIHWHSDIIRQKYIYKFYKYVENCILKKSDLILCTSPNYYTKNPVLSEFLNKTKYLPIGLDLNTLKINEDLYNSLKSNDTNSFKIIFIGRLVGYKGLKYLIKAFSSLNHQFELNIVGDGPLLLEMKNLVNELKLDNQVNFLGNINDEDKYSYLKYSDILVLPSISRNEAYGIAQIEAMAFGKPVISTKIHRSGVDWVNDDGKTGFVVPIQDSKALSISINKLFIEKDTYKVLSKNCFKKFNDMFIHKNIVMDLNFLYNDLLNNK